MMKILGLRRKRAPLVSRIDRRKTRRDEVDLMLDDSDEGSYCSSTTSDGSDSEYRESEDASRGSDTNDSESPAPSRAHEEDDDDDDDDDNDSNGTDKEEKCAVSRTQRKRSASACALNDATSESSDSDVGTEPLRKAAHKKRRLNVSDSDGETERKRVKEARDAAAKRRERKNKLIELLKQRKTGAPLRRRRTLGSAGVGDAEENPEDDKGEAKESEDESSEKDTLRLIDSSEEEKQADTDSLKDFIVEDDEQKEGEEEDKVVEKEDKTFRSHLPRQFITGSHFTYFQVVVKALLINALDTSFLKSLYDGERTKRYAEEMKSSLHHFDERLVLPRLENLMLRSRWKERYKERVECYPKVRVNLVNTRTKSCEACELHRTGRFCVRLSGQLYHTTTLQEDQFMPNDSQIFFVGSVCASRTEVYHALKHYKYHLFVLCRTALEDHKETEQQTQDGEEDEPVKETVNKVYEKLMEEGWITKQYDEFQERLNAADFFQEEKLD